MSWVSHTSSRFWIFLPIISTLLISICYASCTEMATILVDICVLETISASRLCFEQSLDAGEQCQCATDHSSSLHHFSFVKHVWSYELRLVCSTYDTVRDIHEKENRELYATQNLNNLPVIFCSRFDFIKRYSLQKNSPPNHRLARRASAYAGYLQLCCTRPFSTHDLPRRDMVQHVKES